MTQELPILYSFRRCPYAMRARLALAVSQQACVLREVELRNRPQELRDASAKATVPVLVLPAGRVLDESLEIMHWTLANNDPDAWLPTSPARRKEIASLIADCDGEFKHHLDRYKYADRYPGAVSEQHRRAASEFLLGLNARLLSAPFLCGQQTCLADMALAPFVRQFAFADRDWFDDQEWTALRSWLDRFTASARFATVMARYDAWSPESEELKVTWRQA